MKQTTKNILGVAAIVLLSSGVAGLTTYKMLNKEKPATFSELFEQNPNNLQLAAYNATDAQPVDLPHFRYSPHRSPRHSFSNSCSIERLFQVWHICSINANTPRTDV